MKRAALFRTRGRSCRAPELGAPPLERAGRADDHGVLSQPVPRREGPPSGPDPRLVAAWISGTRCAASSWDWRRTRVIGSCAPHDRASPKGSGRGGPGRHRTRDLERLWAPRGPVSAPAAKPARIASLSLATDEMLADLVPSNGSSASHSSRTIRRSRMSRALPGANSPPPRHEPGADRGPRPRPGLRRALQYGRCSQAAGTLGTLAVPQRGLEGIDEIEAGVKRLGERGGRTRARPEARRIDARRRRGSPSPPRPAASPTRAVWAAGVTAGRGTTIDDIIREAGGVNVAAELGLEGSPEISPERVVAADPEIVVLSRWKAEERQGRSRTIRSCTSFVPYVKGMLSRSRDVISRASLLRGRRGRALGTRLHPGRFAVEAGL